VVSLARIYEIRGARRAHPLGPIGPMRDCGKSTRRSGRRAGSHLSGRASVPPRRGVKMNSVFQVFEKYYMDMS